MGYKKINYSSSEKAAFRRGMVAQYNREHPVHRYGVVKTSTTYNEDGSVYVKSNYVTDTCKTLDEAKRYAAHSNNALTTKLQNERVMKAVKAKNVNIYNSDSCTTETYSYKKLDKPVRKGADR